MRLAIVLTCMLLFASLVTAEPYEYSYYPPESPFVEGEEVPGPFPEDQGWERRYGYGTVYREITLDAELLLYSW
jgi:hypothetical protein